MKVERVELKGFLSHRATTWEPNGARLISLIGPNGAGKSTLASDALTFALYGEGRGSADDVVTLGQTDASVVVEFAFNGARYRVTRGRSTRAAGKSFLEFAIADGDRWRPLTRESIRETQGAIAELLRLDADTFSTAVLLGQGKANRFAEATAAERKRILGQVLGLDVYAAAEARARELARDLDATLAVERSQLQRLEDDVAAIDELECQRAEAQAALEQNAVAHVDVQARRSVVEQRIHSIDAELAALASTEEQIARIRIDLDSTAEDWRRAHARSRDAAASIERLEALLQDAGDVAAAIAELAVKAEQLEQLVGAEAEDRRLGTQIQEAHRSILALERPYEAAVTTWRTRQAAAAAKVDELVAHGIAGTSVCQACGQAIGKDTALQQLAAARAALAELGEEPHAPLSIARAEAAKLRLESRRRDLAFDAAAFVATQNEVTRLTATAARAETLESARAQIARERATVAAADEEKKGVEARGLALREQLSSLEQKVTAAAALREERFTATTSLQSIAIEVDALDASSRQLERAIAGADARLEALRRQAEEAARIRETVTAGDVELGRLRRLVTAFGVTGIPARIIEGVLPELAGYANELLEELRPGMTLELRAQRAKRDGKGVVEALDLVVRDVAGERPLALFSGGERMSVSLALAIGLSRLVARRAGARIESLVVDEPDGLDAGARRAFGQALRVVAHRGDLARVVVVSHHDDLAEFGDATYQVTKGPDGSVVELVT